MGLLPRQQEKKKPLFVVCGFLVFPRSSIFEKTSEAFLISPPLQSAEQATLEQFRQPSFLMTCMMQLVILYQTGCRGKQADGALQRLGEVLAGAN